MLKVIGMTARVQFVLTAITVLRVLLLQVQASAVIVMVQSRLIRIMKMKYYFYIVFPLLISLLIFAGCSELEPGISQPQALSVHKPGILTPGHANFHGTLVKENGWSMKECQSCHAADFSGGVAGATCLNCHSGDRGPESCNTCHGSFSNPSRIAPPRDLEDNFLTDSL